MKIFAENPAVAAIEKKAEAFLAMMKGLEESADKIRDPFLRPRFRSLAREYRQEAIRLIEEAKRLARK
jgi:hypothetical protein